MDRVLPAVESKDWRWSTTVLCGILTPARLAVLLAVRATSEELPTEEIDIGAPETEADEDVGDAGAAWTVKAPAEVEELGTRKPDED